MSDDVTRLYGLLKDADRSKAIGDSIIKALITDLLRARLGFSGAAAGAGVGGGVDVRAGHWERVSSWDRSIHWERVVIQSGPPVDPGDPSPTRSMESVPEVTKAVERILAAVRLSDDERRIIRDLDIKLPD
jgi:hypothetical protein